MIGIERLYKLIADIDVSADPELWYILRGGTEGDWDCEEHDDKTLGSTLAAIANQIEREQGGRVSRMRVLAVVTEMERHVSGVEGAEDSPVARWARELREALGGDVRDHAADVSVSACDLLPQEDREAISWVREHGGLDHVKAEWRSRVPYDRYERRRQRLLGHIAECETALGRRREIISELNHRVSDLTTENAELRKRAMPEGMCWPVFEDGESLRFGDVVNDVEVRSVVFRDGGILLSDCTSVPGWGSWHSYKEPIKRPAPKVLDVDGVDTSVGDTVYDVGTGEKMWVCSLSEQGAYQCVKLRLINGMSKTLDPCRLTHRRPALDADGVPIKKGDTVYLLPGKWCDKFPCHGFHGGEELEVFADGEASHVPGSVQCREREKSLGSRSTCYPQPSQLTHTKPEPPDSAERIADDIKRMAEEWCSYPSLREASEKAASSVGEATMGVALGNLSKRCRALAERERGE